MDLLCVFASSFAPLRETVVQFNKTRLRGDATRGLRVFLSLSIIVTVALAGLPRTAFAALLNTMLKVSFDSFTPSSVTNTLKLFDCSPGAKVMVPDIGV